MTAGKAERTGLLVLLAALLGALAVEAYRLGVTVDEPSHLLSSTFYWQGRDTLPPRDAPPLLKIWAGWMPNLIGLETNPDGIDLSKRPTEWSVATRMMERMKADRIGKIYWLCRMPMVVLPLLTVVLLWWWARQLFGAGTALLVALLFVLEPTALGHGALIKNDLAATFGYLFFWYRAWKYWREPGVVAAVLLALAALLASLTKMSVMFVLGLAPAIVVVRQMMRPRPGWRVSAWAVACLVVIPIIGIYAAYQFEYDRVSGELLDVLKQDPSLPTWFPVAARVFEVVPIPTGFWEGCLSLFRSNGNAASVYFLGKIWPEGNPWYFLTALGLKVPVEIQILLAVGLVGVLARWRRVTAASGWLLWVMPGFLYVGLASISKLQLGVRLVLPGLPFGLLLCGVAIEWLTEGGWKNFPRVEWRPGVVVVAVLVAGLAFESVRIFPSGITYFNVWAGGPDHGLVYLTDSNLDWGQGLGELARYKRQAGIKKLKLSYFGFDRPERYFLFNEVEMVPGPWSEATAKGEVFQPEPGYYALSASLLPGMYFAPRYRNYYRKFLAMQPIARPGHSIYVYRVDGDGRE